MSTLRGHPLADAGLALEQAMAAGARDRAAARFADVEAEYEPARQAREQMRKDVVP
jgi:hypothetical protein